MGQLQEHFSAGDNAYTYIGGVAGAYKYQNGQSFTALSAYNLNSVKLKLAKDGTPGTIIVELYNADVNHYPTGAALVSGNTNGNTLTSDDTGEWREITFSSSYLLTQGNVYVIVIKCLGWRALWRWQISGNGYATGKAVATVNSGSSWYSPNSGTADQIFENYDDYTFSPPVDIVTVRRLVAAAGNKFYYEDI